MSQFLNKRKNDQHTNHLLTMLDVLFFKKIKIKCKITKFNKYSMHAVRIHYYTCH